MNKKIFPNRSNRYNELFPTLEREFLEGKSLTKIAKEYSVDRGTLSKNLKSLGYTIKNLQNQPRVREDAFSKIDSEESAYWLGFLYADGCVMDDNRIELSLQERDYDHLVKFCTFIRMPTSAIKYRKSTKSYRVSFRNKRMKEDLISLGCIPRKSTVLIYPSEEQVPRSYTRDFCRGYIDGDGYIGIKKGSTGNIPRLSILGTKSFLESLVSEMGFKKLSIRNKEGIFVIEWSAKYVEDYLKALYKDSSIYLSRKYEVLVPFLLETGGIISEEKTGSLSKSRMVIRGEG